MIYCRGQVPSALSEKAEKVLGGAREGFSEEVRLQLKPVRVKEVGLALALRVDPRLTGKLERSPKQRFCFTSFVVTLTSLKDTLKNRENGFRSCYFFCHPILETGRNKGSLT